MAEVLNCPRRPQFRRFWQVFGPSKLQAVMNYISVSKENSSSLRSHHVKPGKFVYGTLFATVSFF